jgi:putative DNA primase/helicase
VGGKGYVVLRLNGVLRRAEALNTSNDFDTVDEIPAFLTPDYRNNAPELVDLQEGSRVTTLRNHYCTLASFQQINDKKGQAYMTAEDIISTMYIINDYIIADPLTKQEMFYQVTSQDTLPNLPQNELKTANLVAKKEITPPPAVNTKNTVNNAPLTIDDLARNIISDMDLIVHNNILYRYNCNHYESVAGQFNTILKQIALNNPTFSNKKINDIRQRVEWLATINDDQVDRNNDYVNFMNGTLNLSSCCIEAKTEKRICFDYIPRNLNLNLKNKEFDEYMNGLFNNDQGTINFVYEIFGYSLLHNLNAQKFFVFYGPPGTGKSALLKMWMQAIGFNNLSTTSITSMLTNRFAMETMRGKLLNAVTEADHSSMIKNTDLLKQLACGETMNLEKKFGGIQKCNLFATQIHCLNYPIVTNDDALNERIICVPFMNRFRNTDKQLTEHLLIESLGGEDAYDYLMLQAVKGLIRFLKRGSRFAVPATVAAATQKFKGAESIENFLDEADINVKNITNYGYKDLATLYQAYCNDIGVIPLSKPKFHQELVHVLPVKVRKYNDERGRRYVSNEA